MLTETELGLIAKKIAKEYWNVEFNLPIRISTRMSQTLGHYKMYNSGEPFEIALSKNLLTYHPYEEIIGILKHELCHWYLDSIGKDASDGDEEFERELKMIGAPSTYYDCIYAKGMFELVVCSVCKDVIGTFKHKKAAQNKHHNPDYYSHCCKATLEYAGLGEVK